MTLHALRHPRGPSSTTRALTLAVLLLTLCMWASCSDANAATSQRSASHKPRTPATPIICSGTLAAPGSLTGTHNGNVSVRGVCEVNEGVAIVKGNLTLLPGSSLVAAYGLDDHNKADRSRLTVDHELLVERGATAILGCESTEFSCLDQVVGQPSLASSTVIRGNLEEQEPLGVVVHHDVIRGSVTEIGGGGGASCHSEGVFTLFKAPVYSDYEDSSISGNLLVSDLNSCWMGLARLHAAGSVSLLDDRLFDPDAIEILSNEITGNLTCADDSDVWDSTDYLGTLWPRKPEPDTVRGTRFGQCVLASPATEGAPLGPTPF
jgi:hypothetical protein